LGINNVIFYDATDNIELRRIIFDHYDNIEKIIIRPYYITHDNLCNEKHLLDQFNRPNISEEVIKYFIDSCKTRFRRNNKNKYKLRLDHEELSFNDSYTEL
jgi:hypothetical protein